MIEIIGVLPHVEHQQRVEVAVSQRVGVVGFLDAELAVLFSQPHPARREVTNAAILELAREGDRVRLIGTAGGGASVEGVVLSLGARARASTGSPALLDGAGAPLSDSLNSAGAGRAGSAGVMGGQALVVSLSEKDARVVAQEFGAAGAGSGFVVAIYPAS